MYQDACAPAEGRAPGDVLMIHHNETESDSFVLFPIPSQDCNDPLNWSLWRKYLNYTLVFGQTVAVFTALSVQINFWAQMSPELNLSFQQLNNAQSAQLAGLAMGCIFFIPFTKKYGRRSTYLISTAAMAAVSWWSTYMKTYAEVYLTNLFYGLAGATNETVVQMTIADVFFVHQRGTANAFYITGVMIGTFLTPMAAGIQAKYTGWRDSYLAVSISLTILFVIFVFAYEETKYVPVLEGVSEAPSPDSPTDTTHQGYEDEKEKVKESVDTSLHQTKSNARGSAQIPPATYRQRLRLVTYSPESLWKVAYFPMYVVLVPHVLFAAIQYAAGVSWLVILVSTISIRFTQPPYNFSTDGVGLMSLGPFVGNLLGSFYCGLLGDRSVRWLAKRNGGWYEPEMRLYLLLPPAFCMAGGIIMFGMTTDRGMHWIYPSIGGAFFAFGFGAIGDSALTLVIDAYRPLTAEAFVGVTFLRNAIGIPVPFIITPWMNAMGLSNMYITEGLISFVICLLFVPLIIWGKRIRLALAPRYQKLLEQQGGLTASVG